MTKQEWQWVIVGLCGVVMLLALIILIVQLNLQRHLRAHSRAIKNGQVEGDWRTWPTKRLP